MDWTAFNSFDTEKFINLVRDDTLAPLFEAEKLRADYAPIEFYEDARLIMLQNITVAPAFTLEFIESGDDIVYMDGSATPFEHLNTQDHIQLNEDTLLDYVTHYCAYVIQPHDNVLVLRDEEEYPFQDSFYIDFQFDRQNFSEKNIEITRTAENNGYIMKAPLIFGGKIDMGLLKIGDNGSVNIERANPR